MVEVVVGGRTLPCHYQPDKENQKAQKEQKRTHHQQRELIADDALVHLAELGGGAGDKAVVAGHKGEKGRDEGQEPTAQGPEDLIAGAIVAALYGFLADSEAEGEGERDHGGEELGGILDALGDLLGFAPAVLLPGLVFGGERLGHGSGFRDQGSWISR